MQTLGEWEDFFLFIQGLPFFMQHAISSFPGHPCLFYEYSSIFFSHPPSVLIILPCIPSFSFIAALPLKISGLRFKREGAGKLSAWNCFRISSFHFPLSSGSMPYLLFLIIPVLLLHIFPSSFLIHPALSSFFFHNRAIP